MRHRWSAGSAVVFIDSQRVLCSVEVKVPKSTVVERALRLVLHRRGVVRLVVDVAVALDRLMSHRLIVDRPVVVRLACLVLDAHGWLLHRHALTVRCDLLVPVEVALELTHGRSLSNLRHELVTERRKCTYLVCKK